MWFSRYMRDAIRSISINTLRNYTKWRWRDSNS